MCGVAASGRIGGDGVTVKVEDRQESKVEYLDTARQISKRTAQMVANGPKKYLATYGDHLMRLSLKLFTHVDIANSIYVTSERDHEQRRSHLVEARGLCYSIESTAKLYTDLMTASHTASSEKAYGRLADIARLCHKERGLIKGVMESDRKRYNARKAAAR